MATKFLNTIKFPGLDDTYIVNDLDIIAPGYDDTKEYKIGNLLTYLGKQYYCIADATAGTLPTNTTYFEEKSVADIIEMIKNGSIVTGHSEVADNLTPYSEDSGTTQENPFISQGTGTDNNSVIVTTGTIARQLEKQGNTVVKNQQIQNPNFTDTSNWGCYSYTTTLSASNNELTATGTTTGVSVSQYLANKIPSGHKVLVMFDIKSSTSTSGFGIFIGNILDVSHNLTENYQHIASVYTLTTDATRFEIAKGGSQSAPSITLKNVYVIDLTQWGFSSDIITDLTSHPEHFSWYYNGSLAYDAGSLQNCNGRYLECGQGRNLFDQVMELGDIDSTTGADTSSSSLLRSKNFIPVVPNKPIYIYAGSGDYLRFRYYDANKNYIGALDAQGNSSGKNVVRYMLPNCYYMRITTEYSYGTTYKNDISIELYYTPEEGGEGYGEMHDYVAPIRIDTGNETLKAFDKKLPSGVIERNTGEVDLATLAWTYQYGHWTSTSLASVIKTYGQAGLPKGICSSLALVPQEYQSFNNNVIGAFGVSPTGTLILVNGSDSVSPTGTFQYELATPTTEQGTAFSEYAPINDYSYMAWFDTDGNLVSIPQGCKLFYPVDYKGFTDDLVMYTNGDATALAKNEDITDTALNARGYYKLQDLLTAFGANGMVGGTLRNTLVAKESLDFNNTNCIDLSTPTWIYNNSRFECNVPISDMKRPASNSSPIKALCTIYKIGNANDSVNLTFAVNTSGELRIFDNTLGGSVTNLLAKIKGQLLTYEKA